MCMVSGLLDGKIELCLTYGSCRCNHHVNWDLILWKSLAEKSSCHRYSDANQTLGFSYETDPKDPLVNRVTPVSAVYQGSFWRVVGGRLSWPMAHLQSRVLLPVTGSKSHITIRYGFGQMAPVYARSSTYNRFVSGTLVYLLMHFLTRRVCYERECLKPRDMFCPIDQLAWPTIWSDIHLGQRSSLLDR